MIPETRTTIATVDPMTRRVMDMRDEELRLAQFKYSRTVMAGSRADWRMIDGPVHDAEHD